MKSDKSFDVIVVGAGAAGVGVGMALKRAGVKSMTLLEREAVGASFRRWPEEMRFITPSFPSNAFGIVDLNAVNPSTSPAFSLSEEHPAGRQYARYLDAMARWDDLPVRTGVDVRSVSCKNEGFSLETNDGTYTARFIVWAAGELQYPQKGGFTGAELCVHNSEVKSWRSWEGESIAVIGGYESGIDTAYHLSRAGKSVVVIDPNAPWKKSDESDPSLVLSPYTMARLRQMQKEDVKGQVRFIAEKVRRVEEQNGQFIVRTETQEVPADSHPVLATGFQGSLTLIRDLLDWDAEEGFPVLTQSADESTQTPGLFVCGPMVRHRTENGLAVLCFIYKFRMRFALIAAEIASRMQLDASSLSEYEDANMVLRDLAACCGSACSC
ncbi:MAG: NAD(P)/FAD-dependent oxidoreductase [Desulfobacter sp.]